MTKKIISLLLLAAFALSGEIADDLTYFRKTFVTRYGVQDPGDELKAALKAGDAAWRNDVAFARQARPKFDYVRDAAAERRVARVFPRLLEAAGARYQGVKVELYKSPIRNAMTIGGDRIYFEISYLRTFDDAELANVLAHELSHILARHTHRKIRFFNKLSGSQGRKEMAMCVYSRLLEAEADVMSTVLLKRAGLRVVVTHWQKQIRSRPNPFLLRQRLGRLNVAISRMVIERTQLEQRFRFQRTESISNRLGDLRDRLARARAEHKQLQHALDHQTHTSEHTHPQHETRMRLISAGAAGSKSHHLVAYVLDAMDSPESLFEQILRESRRPARR